MQRVRPTQTDPETLLREILQAQAEIARGKGKGVTSAQQTAAAKEVRELLLSLQGYAPAQKGIAWEDVPEVQREACRQVLTLGDAFALLVLDLAPEWEPGYEQGGDDAGQASRPVGDTEP